MTRQLQCANKMAAVLRKFVETVGYGPENVVVLENFRDHGPAVAVEISGFTFMPFREVIEISLDSYRTSIPFRVPDTCFAENYFDGVAVIYKARA